MKDKLRELAAEWLRKGEFSKNSGAPRCGGQMIEDATELLAILDAEGDGGAVGTVTSFTDGSYHRNYKVAWHRNDLPVDTKLYAHPARSGVVSNEDVEAAIDAHNHAIYRNGNNRKLAMRAALEHFAKGERHGS